LLPAALSSRVWLFGSSGYRGAIAQFSRDERGFFMLSALLRLATPQQ
jgi:hypothetical protein